MKQKSFTSFAREVVDELQRESRFATAHIYHYALEALTSSIGGGEIFWGGISKSALRNFQLYLENHQKCYNTISTYIRALRAIYNRAVDRGYIKGEYRLFANLKTGVASERKLALTASQMNVLLSDDSFRQLPSDVQRAQDVLRLMLLLQGMPYVDLVHLRKSDIKGDMLVCRRRKTGTELCIRLMPQTLRLIERYRNHDDSSPYLLDILTSNLSGEAAFDEYNHCLRRLNLSLTRLAEMCGMGNLKLSSYTARHTWATLAKYCQVPEEVISEGLGHSSLDVTRTYLKSFETDELDRANRIVNSYISTGRKGVWSRGR